MFLHDGGHFRESLSGTAGETEEITMAVQHIKPERNIEQGKTDADIRSFLVSRYGDFVLYKPEVKPVTWLLWFGPFVLLMGALVLALRLMRRTPAEPAPLTDSERARVRQLLES